MGVWQAGFTETQKLNSMEWTRMDHSNSHGWGLPSSNNNPVSSCCCLVPDTMKYIHKWLLWERVSSQEVHFMDWEGSKMQRNKHKISSEHPRTERRSHLDLVPCTGFQRTAKFRDDCEARNSWTRYIWSGVEKGREVGKGKPYAAAWVEWDAHWTQGNLTGWDVLVVVHVCLC